jgi:hypothetical protein
MKGVHVGLGSGAYSDDDNARDTVLHFCVFQERENGLESKEMCTHREESRTARFLLVHPS